MALNGNQWGTELYNALGIGTDPNLSSSEKADILSKMQAIGNVHALHIQTNAIVSTILAVTNVSGVTPGGGVSGPGTGTGVGTVA